MSSSSTNSPPRALLIAEQANPEWVSVPLEGWSHSTAIKRLCDGHIVTQIRNRASFLRAGLEEGKDFTAIDSEAVAATSSKIASALRGGRGKGWTLNTAMNTLAYYYFERCVWRRFGDEIRSHKWDLVHRITPLSPTAPSLLAKHCHKAGVPFVLGPLNGGLPWPNGFDATRRREREWLSYVRSGYKLLPGYHATRRYADAIIAGSRATWEQVPEKYRQKCIYIPENAVEPSRFDVSVDRPIESPIRVAFVGRLVPYKGADMLLRAAAPLVRAGKVVIDIIGDGPEKSALQSIVEEESLCGRVKLDGFVEHSQLKNRLVQSDVFGFPSIREFGGVVVLEAMALKLVPLIVDYGGPGELVTENSGLSVPIGSRDEIVAGVRSQLEWLVSNSDRIRPMGEHGRRRALTQFSWDAKAKQVLEVYRWVLGRGERPEFGMPLPELVNPSNLISP